MAELASVADLIMGQSPPSSCYNETGEGLPFFQGKVDFGPRHPRERVYCSAPRKIAKPRDILISVRAPVGPVNIADRECCIGRGLVAVRAKGIDGEFLYFNLLYAEKLIAGLGSGSTFHAINKAQLSTVVVNELDFDRIEQQKMAGVLSQVQRAIEQQERLIALTSDLKKSLMHKLFTEGLRGEPQKQTEIGPMPESWGVVALGSQYNTQLGKMLSQKARTGADPRAYLRNKNVQWGLIDTTDLLSMSYSEREREKFQLVSGDLLVCEGGEPGRAAIWHGEIEDCYYQKALLRVRPKSTSVSNEYLAFWLEYSIRYHDLYSTGGASSTIAHLPEVQLRLLPVPLPSREEQDSIVEFIAATDEKAATHRHKRAALSDLFRTLLHQLMTGQIRANGLDVASLDTE